MAVSEPRDAVRTVVVSQDIDSVWAVGRELLRRGHELIYRADIDEARRLLVEDPRAAGLIDLDAVPRAERSRFEGMIADDPERALIVTGSALDAAQRAELALRGVRFVLQKPMCPLHVGHLVQMFAQRQAPWLPALSENLSLYLKLAEALEMKSSGELVVRDAERAGRIFLVGDRLAWTVIVNARDTLADDLYARVGLEKAELQVVLEECRQQGSNFAETLIQWGFITKELMRDVLLRRTARNLGTMLEWSAPEALFVPQHRSYGSHLTFTLLEILRCLAGSCGGASPQIDPAIDTDQGGHVTPRPEENSADDQ